MNENQDTIREFSSEENKGFINFLLRTYHDIASYRYALFNFIGTNLRARYRRSAIGFLWSLLNPLFTMIILTLVFSAIYKSSFAKFGIYLFSGLLPWNLIANSMMNGSTTIVLAESYLKKVYIPKLLFPLVTVSVEVVNFMLSLISLSILAFVLGAKLSLSLLFLPLALLLTSLFMLGIVLIFSVATVFFRDLSHIIQIAITGFFYLTPIVYHPEILPEQFLAFIKFNPLFYFIELFHAIIYQANIPDFGAWLLCGLLTFLSLMIGLAVFYFKENDLIYRL